MNRKGFWVGCAYFVALTMIAHIALSLENDKWYISLPLLFVSALLFTWYGDKRESREIE